MSSHPHIYGKLVEFDEKNYKELLSRYRKLMVTTIVLFIAAVVNLVSGLVSDNIFTVASAVVLGVGVFLVSVQSGEAHGNLRPVAAKREFVTEVFGMFWHAAVSDMSPELPNASFYPTVTLVDRAKREIRLKLTAVDPHIGVMGEYFISPEKVATTDGSPELQKIFDELKVLLTTTDDHALADRQIMARFPTSARTYAD